MSAEDPGPTGKVWVVYARSITGTRLVRAVFVEDESVLSGDEYSRSIVRKKVVEAADKVGPGFVPEVWIFRLGNGRPVDFWPTREPELGTVPWD